MSLVDNFRFFFDTGGFLRSSALAVFCFYSLGCFFCLCSISTLLLVCYLFFFLLSFPGVGVRVWGLGGLVEGHNCGIQQNVEMLLWE